LTAFGGPSEFTAASVPSDFAIVGFSVNPFDAIVGHGITVEVTRDMNVVAGCRPINLVQVVIAIFLAVHLDHRASIYSRWVLKNTFQ
jgi:hypothetical protein